MTATLTDKEITEIMGWPEGAMDTVMPGDLSERVRKVAIAAAAAEREACARACDLIEDFCPAGDGSSSASMCADSIRSRGKS